MGSAKDIDPSKAVPMPGRQLRQHPAGAAHWDELMYK
jgi:hypothetical protein